ncbi:alpha-induced protein 8-like protein 2 B, partial [Nothobranchius furzeri]
MEFSSKDMALKAQKKILSSMANRSSVQMFIDDTTSEILDELYRVSKEYTGNKAEAQKILKNLIKIAVKIGLLFRNNRFNEEELVIAKDFKKKLNQGAMTATSFYEVNSHILKGIISDFLSDLVLNTDKVIVVGDFNIHVDIENDCLNVAFSNILDSIGFTQRIHSSTHSCHHTLDLVLTYGIECEEITIF